MMLIKTLKYILITLGLALFAGSFRLLGRPAANVGVQALPHRYELAYASIKPSQAIMANSRYVVGANTVSAANKPSDSRGVVHSGSATKTADTRAGELTSAKAPGGNNTHPLTQLKHQTEAVDN